MHTAARARWVALHTWVRTRHICTRGWLRTRHTRCTRMLCSRARRSLARQHTCVHALVWGGHALHMWVFMRACVCVDVDVRDTDTDVRCTHVCNDHIPPPPHRYQRVCNEGRLSPRRLPQHRRQLPLRVQRGGARGGAQGQGHQTPPPPSPPTVPFQGSRWPRAVAKPQHQLCKYGGAVRGGKVRGGYTPYADPSSCPPRPP